MADDALTLTLSGDTAARLSAQAEAAGVSPQALALSILGEALRDGASADRPNADAAQGQSANRDVNEPGRAWNAAALQAPVADEAGAHSRFTTRPGDYDGPYVELEEALSAFAAEADRRLVKSAE